MSEEHEKIIKLVQSSTRNILSHYRERAKLLSECSGDVKLLIREGHDPQIAQDTAKRFFGTQDNISFLAIDGTKSQDEALTNFEEQIKFIETEKNQSRFISPNLQ